jgi:SAM-dependent MidA family methyltransferase
VFDLYPDEFATVPTALKIPLNARQAAQMPRPDADALAHSQACAAMIRREIDQAGGWISFARFMELALYAPGLGYYAAGARKFGASGDFVTAPEISALFGQCLARAIAPALAETGGDVLELGPGSGKLAADILRELAAINALPSRYLLLEVSADLRQRQQLALAALPATLSSRAHWIDALPADFAGAVIANEVLDVVPVHLLGWMAGGTVERGVAVDTQQQFIWQDMPLLSGELTAMAAQIRAGFGTGGPPPGYLSEAAPAVGGLVKSLAAMLRHGVLLLVDYGFRRAEYYHPSRGMGTLMCHYRHFAHADPFFLPGLQDITAHVDFSSVAEAALDEGLELLGYATQAQFLLQAGITELIGRHDPADSIAYLPLTSQAQRLLSPAEMGEFFKVIGFSRGNASLPALAMARPLPL